MSSQNVQLILVAFLLPKIKLSSEYFIAAPSCKHVRLSIHVGTSLPDFLFRSLDRKISCSIISVCEAFQNFMLKSAPLNYSMTIMPDVY